MQLKHSGVSEALPEEERTPLSPEKTTPQQALREAQLEDKYDGMRAQLHCGDPNQPERVALFSRNREDISESFPELIEAFENIHEPAILDGEIVALEPGRAACLALHFACSSDWEESASPTKCANKPPVVFVAFDLLYLEEELLLERPLSERRNALEDFIAKHSETTANCVQRGQAHLFADESINNFPHLILAPATRLASARTARPRLL